MTCKQHDYQYDLGIHIAFHKDGSISLNPLEIIKDAKLLKNYQKEIEQIKENEVFIKLEIKKMLNQATTIADKHIILEGYAELLNDIKQSNQEKEVPVHEEVLCR